MPLIMSRPYSIPAVDWGSWNGSNVSSPTVSSHTRILQFVNGSEVDGSQVLFVSDWKSAGDFDLIAHTVSVDGAGTITENAQTTIDTARPFGILVEQWGSSGKYIVTYGDVDTSPRPLKAAVISVSGTTVSVDTSPVQLAQLTTNPINYQSTVPLNDTHAFIEYYDEDTGENKGIVVNQSLSIVAGPTVVDGAGSSLGTSWRGSYAGTDDSGNHMVALIKGVNSNFPRVLIVTINPTTYAMTNVSYLSGWTGMPSDSGWFYQQSGKYIGDNQFLITYNPTTDPTYSQGPTRVARIKVNPTTYAITNEQNVEAITGNSRVGAMTPTTNPDEYCVFAEAFIGTTQERYYIGFINATTSSMSLVSTALVLTGDYNYIWAGVIGSRVLFAYRDDGATNIINYRTTEP